MGVFYINSDGFIACGGSAIFEGNQIAIAAWEDNPSSFMIDGFQTGDSFIFLVFRDGLVYETTTILNNSPPFTNIFGANNFGQVTELSIGDEFIEDCLEDYDVDKFKNDVRLSIHAKRVKTIHHQKKYCECIFDETRMLATPDDAYNFILDKQLVGKCLRRSY